MLCKECYARDAKEGFEMCGRCIGAVKRRKQNNNDRRRWDKDYQENRRETKYGRD